MKHLILISIFILCFSLDSSDDYTESLKIIPLGEDYTLTRFEFNYTYYHNKSNLFKYLPSDLYVFLKETSFEEINIDFALGRWREAVQNKIFRKEDSDLNYVP